MGDIWVEFNSKAVAEKYVNRSFEFQGRVIVTGYSKDYNDLETVVNPEFYNNPHNVEIKMDEFEPNSLSLHFCVLCCLCLFF